MSVNELYNLIRTEDCCLWIGSGFSLNAGYPSAQELQTLLFQDLDEEEQTYITPNSALSQFCSEYETIKSRSLLVKRLADIFETHPAPSEQHVLLSKISHFKSIITTNYDRLIENSYSSLDRTVIKCDDDVPDQTSRTVKIYKVHGDLDDGKDIVITREDYSKQYNRNFKDPFWGSIIHEISTKHVIFLGYGYEDENVWADFDHIQTRLGGKGKKRFMVGPTFTFIKRRKLEKLKITPIAMTGYDFLSGLIPVLKKHLATDLRKGLVSSDIAIQFARNFNVDLKLSSSPAGINVLGFTNSTGNTEHVVKLQITDPKVIETITDFGKSYDQLKIDITQESLQDFSLTAAGFELIDRDFLHEFRIMHVPSAQGSCSLEYPDLDKEFSGIDFKLYNSIPGKLLLDLDYQGFKLIIRSHLNIEEIEFNLQVIEPKFGARVSTCVSFYEALCYFLSGERLLIHRYSGDHFKFHLTENRNIPAYSKSLGNFILLRKIEKAFGVTFQNVSGDEFYKQNQTDLKKLFAVAENGGYSVNEVDGIEFHALPDHVDWDKVVSNGFPSNEWVIFSTNEPMCISIFGVSVNLGLFEVEMFGPTIEWADRVKSSILLKTKDDNFIFRFLKFGNSPFIETQSLL